jgi:hypothetical protein
MLEPTLLGLLDGADGLDELYGECVTAIEIWWLAIC